MPTDSRSRFLFTALLSTSLAASVPADSLACACGCGVFDVSTSAMLPTQEGGMVWTEYDFLNQDRNWSHTSGAPSASNDDKDIKTHFFTAGAQYMFSRAWGVEATVPYWSRHFTTTDENTGDVNSFNHSAIGDIRVKGIYTGFSPDMGSGLTFGVKLPTGDYRYAHFDRDTQIGTGSTDLLLGGYHRGQLGGAWYWFANAQWDQPLLTRGDYRPGSEVDAAGGVYYHEIALGPVSITPMLQAINLYRLHDNGLNAFAEDTGYERVLLAPGLEAEIGSFRVYGDVEVPVYQQVRGNQLIAPLGFKLNISRSF